MHLTCSSVFYDLGGSIDPVDKLDILNRLASSLLRAPFSSGALTIKAAVYREKLYPQT
jgi:hypothetical protein